MGRAARIWLLALLGLCGAYHAGVSWRQSQYGWGNGLGNVSVHHSDGVIDAGYYASIAVMVRDGHGFKTNVSLLHKGDEVFPAPSSVYPLWPLTWGYLARVIPLDQLGAWLPALFYLVSLLAAYQWLHALWPRAFFPRHLPGFQAGHVLVCVLALSSFFTSTLYPIVEGLAYALMFCAFWRFNTLLARPSWRSGLECGAWLALVLLARAQLVVAAGAMFLVLGCACVAVPGQRARYASMLGASVAAFAALSAPWFTYTWSFAPHATITQVLAFAGVRPNQLLSPLEGVRSGAAAGGWLTDRLEGLMLAFRWRSPDSYWPQYYTFHYALIVALLLALLAVVSSLRHAGLRAFRPWLTDCANVPRVFAIAYASLAFLALHTMHTAAWYFHRRHGLGSLLLIAFALAYVLAQRHIALRLVGVIILCSGVALGCWRLVRETQHALREGPRPTPPIVHWLAAQTKGREPLVVAVRQPQLIGYQLPHIGFHWFNQLTTRADVELMVTRLGASYVAVPSSMSEWWRSRGRNFKLLAHEGDDTIYRPNKRLRERARRRFRAMKAPSRSAWSEAGASPSGPQASRRRPEP